MDTTEKKPRPNWFLIASGASMMLALVLVVILLLPKLRGGAPAQWTMYVSPEGKFKAFFCGKIKEMEVKVSADVTNHTVISDNENGVGMGVTWTDYPPKTFGPGSPPDAILDAMAIAATRAGGMLTDHNKGVKDGLPFAEVAFTSDIDGSHNRHFVTLSGLRIYTVFAHEPAGDPSHQVVSQFMNSFTVTR